MDGIELAKPMTTACVLCSYFLTHWRRWGLFEVTMRPIPIGGPIVLFGNFDTSIVWLAL